jgi:hypothetical protein
MGKKIPATISGRLEEGAKPLNTSVTTDLRTEGIPHSKDDCGPVDHKQLSKSRSRSHITTDSESASQSWCQAPIWDPRPIFLSS